MAQRIHMGKAEPAAYKAVGELEKQVRESLDRAGIPEGFVHLLKLRASQINGCSYCVRLHARDARATGESEDRIALTAAWRESSYFSEEERASFDLMEAITLIHDGQLADEVYENAASVLTEQKIAALEWLAVVINVWNRIAVPSRYPVTP